MTDPLTPEEEVIREWVAAMTTESGAPLPPSLRNAEPLPRRRVLPVIVTLLEIIDDLRAAPPVPAGPTLHDMDGHEDCAYDNCEVTRLCPRTSEPQFAPPVQAGDERERLAVEIDRHWLLRTEDGVFRCTADDWTYGPDDTIAEGDRLAPFSAHIADRLLAAGVRLTEGGNR